MSHDDRPLVLLIGATGLIGSAVIHELGRRARVRALVRTEASDTAIARRYPMVERVYGDLRDPATLPSAFDGVDRVFLLTPSVADQTELVLERWRSYADGLEPGNLVGRYVSSPIDIERVMPSMRHGDWNHGEMTQDQLGIFRPFFEYPPYRTAFENVYLCGASTHPGGSISGACGRNAAGAICEDLGIERWWRQ